VGGVTLRVRPTPERPLSPWVISTGSHSPDSIAAAAWRTWIINEQPPTAVPTLSRRVGNEPLPGADKGWVSTLIDNFSALLAMSLGRRDGLRGYRFWYLDENRQPRSWSGSKGHFTDLIV
jgi:hypothetical protein